MADEPKALGAWTLVQDATVGNEWQQLADAVRAEVEKKTGKNFEKYEAKQYRSQVVNGTNYVMKIYTGGDPTQRSYIHVQFLWIFVSLRTNPMSEEIVTDIKVDQFYHDELQPLK